MVKNVSGLVKNRKCIAENDPCLVKNQTSPATIQERFLKILKFLNATFTAKVDL
jgi:hypothetical protein